jgi:hypothetical protein
MRVAKGVDMADIQEKLVGLCEAFNAHDPDLLLEDH